jgi:hypothetical protein
MNACLAIPALARAARTAIAGAGVLLAACAVGLAAEPAPPAERPPLALVGTVVGNGKALAIFNEQSTGRIVFLHVGDMQDGWRVRSIGAGRVTFENEEQRANYVLAERATGQLQRPYLPPAPVPVPPGTPAQAGKSQSAPARAAGAPGSDLPAKKAAQPEVDPVADWFRRQRR